MNEEKNWIITEDDLLEDPTKILDSPWLNMNSYYFIKITVPELPAEGGFYCIKATFTKNYPSDPPILMALTPIDSYEPFEIVPLEKFGIHKWDPTIRWKELWESVDKTLSSSGNHRLNDVYLDLLLAYLFEYNLIIYIKNYGYKLLEAELDSLAPSTIEDLINFQSLLEATELTLTSDQVNENEKEVQKKFMFNRIVYYEQQMATSKVKMTTSYCKENMHNCWYFLAFGPENSCYNYKLFFGHILFSEIDPMQIEHLEILSPFLRRINFPKIALSNKLSGDFIILYQYTIIRCIWEQYWAYFMSNINKSLSEYNAIEDKENIELDYKFSVNSFDEIIKDGNLGKVFKQLAKTLLEFYNDYYKTMSSLESQRRLKQDFKSLILHPIPNIYTRPIDDTFMVWNFVVVGPEKTPFEGGYYQGTIFFSSNFLLEPPKVVFLTPNGVIKLHQKIDLTIFEKWAPSNTVSSILLELSTLLKKEFDKFIENALKTWTTDQTIAEKATISMLAKESIELNKNDATFCKYFQDLLALCNINAQEKAQFQGGKSFMQPFKSNARLVETLLKKRFALHVPFEIWKNECQEDEKVKSLSFAIMTAITNKGKKEEKVETIKPRLQTDYETLVQQPIPNIVAHPLDATLLEWRFVVIGPQETPFENGYYQGRINFSPKFPFEPPIITFITPNGLYDDKTPINLIICNKKHWNSTTTISSILFELSQLLVDNYNIYKRNSDYVLRTMGYFAKTEEQKDEAEKELFSEINFLSKESIEFNYNDPVFYLLPMFNLKKI
uniref:UBC core domain-containing protein n=1 Tax=Acrobeloides nanus TaxID=290746 RepID=A0A914C4D8_9BILA